MRGLCVPAVLPLLAGRDDTDMYEGRDLPVTTDFRDVFNEVLEDHLGFRSKRGFFLDYRPGGGVGLIA